MYNKWDMAKELVGSDNIEIVGHTHSHPSLPKLSLEEKRKESIESKKTTEQRCGIKLTSFEYPYGDLDKEVVEIVKEVDYSFAVSTDIGPGVLTDDLFDIRRSGIDKTTLFDFLRKISFMYSIYKGRKYSEKEERR